MPLLSDLHHDQKQIVRHADAAADAAERIVHHVWDDILQIATSSHGNYFLLLRALRPLLAALAGHLIHTMAHSLGDASRHAHVQAVDQLLSDMPEAAASKIIRRRGLLEDAGDVLTTDQLFPPLTESEVFRLVYSGDWTGRIAAQTSLASPDLIASIIAQGFQGGKTIQQIARQLQPIVQGVQTTARRIARTEGVRVAHESQMAAWEQIPDLIIGYQIHSVHGNPNSRWWHLRRDGRKYFRNPAAGQDGFDKLPRPPLEAPDASERPADTPEVAHNCLCYLTPIFAE